MPDRRWCRSADERSPHADLQRDVAGGIRCAGSDGGIACKVRRGRLDCVSVPCPGRATLQAARKSCRRAPFGALACLRGNERFVVHGGPSGGQLPEAVAVVFVVAVATPAPQSARCRVPTPETVRGLAPASRRGHNPRPAAQREADPARGEIHAPDVADRCRHATRRLLSCNPIHSACPEHPPNTVPRSC